MECPYCGWELEYIDSYGNMDYIIYGDISGKRGDIYRCPHSEGFYSEADALEYANAHDTDYEHWEEISCDSECHNGHFYTDMQGSLTEGYPC